MRPNKKVLSILLALTMLAAVIYPALAGTLTVTPAKPAYTGGETVTVAAEVYEGGTKVTSGIEWSYLDKDQARRNLSGDGDTIRFTVPVNNTDATVASVVYAVYKGQEQWAAVSIEPGQEKITITADKTAIVVKEIIKLTAEVKDKNGDPMPDGRVNWESSAPGTAKVNEGGCVTGVAAGTAAITASLQSAPEVKAQIEITVGAGELPPLKLVALNPPDGARCVAADAEISLVFNQPVAFSDGGGKVQADLIYDDDYDGELDGDCMGYGDNTKHRLVFSEVDPGKVVVQLFDAGGKAMQLEDNHCYEVGVVKNWIKAKEGGALFDTDIVWRFDTRPLGPVPYRLIIDRINTSRLNVGATLQMAALVKDVDGQVIPGYKVNWKTNQPESATVDENGLVRAISPGLVTISASADKCPNVKHNGYRIEVRANFTRQLMPKWTYNISGNQPSSAGHPAVGADGSTYTMLAPNYKTDKNYKILALDPGGTVKENFISPVITMPPVAARVNGRECLLTARDNTFLALTPETGAVLWQVELDAKIGTMAAVGKNGNIFVGCIDGRLYAVNSEVGRYLWKFDAEGQIIKCGATGEGPDSTPTVDGAGNVYVVSGNTLWVVDGNTGGLLWKFANPKHEKINCQAAVGSDGTVYIYDYPMSRDIAKTIYALTPPAAAGGEAAVRWSKNYNYVGLRTPFIDRDGGVYFQIVKDAGAPVKFVKLDPGSVEIIEEHPFSAQYARLGPDGCLYTDKAIYDISRAPIAYYDDYRNNLPYFQYIGLALDAGGTLYRLRISTGKAVGLEAASLYDMSNSVITDLKVSQEDIILYPGETRRVKAEVLDQNGLVLPALELQWQSSDLTVARVGAADGLITALKKVGEATVTVKVKDKLELSREIKIRVLAAPVPQRMVFVVDDGKYPDQLDQRQPAGEKVTGYVGESLSPVVTVFIEDQNGKFVRKQPVKWSLADPGLADMLNYEGGGGDYYIRYNAVLVGKKAGTTTLTASLVNYPQIQCSLEIEVLPAQHQVLWSVPLEGHWGQQRAYHVMGPDGEIFYVNDNKLRAVRKDTGAPLWVADPGGYFGIRISPPQLDAGGTIYVHGTDSTAVVAVSPGDGSVIWSFVRGTDPVKHLKIAPDCLYALTGSGDLYRLDKGDGRPLWDSPLNVSKDSGGLAVSEAGRLYLAEAGAVYEIGAGKEKNLLYNDAAGAALRLEEVTAAGDLIVQRELAGKYSLLSLSPGGTVNWTYDRLKGRVFLSCDRAGAVYAVSCTKEYLEDLYFLNADGTEKTVTTLADKSSRGVYKPVIGRDGLVYIAIGHINVVDGRSGELQWKAGLWNWGLISPDTITVDEDGVVYATMAASGLVALKGVAQTMPAGLQLSVGGGKDLRPDSLRDLTVKVTNNQAAEQEILLLIGLCDGQSDSFVSYASFTDTLAAGAAGTYSGGVTIPAAESCRVRVQVLDNKTPDKTLLREVILPVVRP